MPSPQENNAPVQFATLAQFALNMTAQVSIKADEQSLLAALHTRQMLLGIAEGRLVVGTPVPPQTPQLPDNVSRLAPKPPTGSNEPPPLKP